MTSALVTERKNKPLVSHVCAALVIQRDPKSQRSTEVEILLDKDVDSLYGIIKIFPSLTAPAPAAASGKTQQPNTGALEILDLLKGIVPQESGLADAATRAFSVL